MISWKLVMVSEERDVTTVMLGPEPVIVGRKMVRDLCFQSFVKISYLLRFEIYKCPDPTSASRSPQLGRCW